MANSMHHNGAKMTNALDKANVIRDSYRVFHRGIVQPLLAIIAK
jgi:hypothetical protein